MKTNSFSVGKWWKILPLLAIVPQVRSLEAMVGRSRQRCLGRAGARAAACVLLIVLTACQGKADQVAHTSKAQDMQMSYSEFNYTDKEMSVYELNHKPVLSFMNKAGLGSVIGGGIVCCIDFPYGVEKVHVNFTDVDFKDIDIEAPVLYDDPEHPGGYAVVHVLPGDKVVVVVTPVRPFPRADLLRTRLRELGIKGVQLESWPTWQEGPRKYGTMPTFVKGKENALNEEP